MSHPADRRETSASEPRAPADAPSPSPQRWVAAAAGAGFLIVAALLCLDYLSGAGERDARAHAAIELSLMAVAVLAGVVSWIRFVAGRRRERLLARDLVSAEAEAARWRRDAEGVLRGLGAAIDDQFGRWELSAAEREVALLLLKGLSYKEIADLRQTSEKTVRQQGLAVYRKAGLSGRAELSAFFLEDLLLPRR